MTRNLLKVNRAWEICVQRCGVPSRSTFYRWLSYGLIPHVKLGRNIRIDYADLEKLIESAGGKTVCRQLYRV